MNEVLQLIILINNMFKIARSLGLSKRRLLARAALAESENRAFDITDVEFLKAEARTALDKLDADIAAAKKQA